MKLIDKDALIAEIDKVTDEPAPSHDQQCPWEDGYYCGLYKAESIIDTLEVKEEILDKEGKTKLMKKCVHKAYKRGYDMGVLKTINEMNHNIKDVDLEKECDNWRHNHFHGRRDKAASGEYLERNSQLDLARHFFELGLRAQKGE